MHLEAPLYSGQSYRPHLRLAQCLYLDQNGRHRQILDNAPRLQPRGRCRGRETLRHAVLEAHSATNGAACKMGRECAITRMSRYFRDLWMSTLPCNSYTTLSSPFRRCLASKAVQVEDSVEHRGNLTPPLLRYECLEFTRPSHQQAPLGLQCSDWKGAWLK